MVYTREVSVSESSIVGPKGRVVIPQRFRDQLGIGEGDEVVFGLNSHGALIMLTRSQLVDSLTGAWSDAKKTAGVGSLVDDLFADRRADAAIDAS